MEIYDRERCGIARTAFDCAFDSAGFCNTIIVERAELLGASRGLRYHAGMLL